MEAAARFTLHQLEVLVAVGETGTVTAAAARLHMSPSAVSSALTELEQRLGVTLLFRRRAKGVRLTSDGTAVLTEAGSILTAAANLQLGAGEAGPVRGHLALGCFPSLAPTMLPELVTRFLAEHTEASVDFREGDQNALRRWLAEGEIDLAIVYDVHTPPEWSLDAIGSLAMKIVVAEDHRLAQVSRPIDLHELRDEPMVMLDVPPSAQRIAEVCARSGFAPKVAYRTPSYETARSFVGRGLGWTLLHQRPPADLTYEGLTVAVMEIGEPSPEPLRIALAHLAEAPLSRVAKGFIEIAVVHHSAAKFDFVAE